MKAEKKFVALAIALGVAVWVIDAILDRFIFYQGTFWDLLLFNMPHHELYIRTVILAAFTLFGFVISRVMAKRKHAEAALRETNREFEQRVRERTAELAQLNTELKQEVERRRRSERELLESDARYRGVIEDIPVLICTFLPGGEISFVNRAYCDYFATTAADLIGTNFKSHIPAAEHKFVMDNISGLTAEAPIQSHEHSVISPTGQIRWQRWTNRAIFDESGCVARYQSIGEDTTDRRLSEQQLKESQAKFKAIFDYAHDGILVADVAAKQLIMANDRFCRMLGYSPADILDLSVYDIHPKNDLPVVLEVFEQQARKRLRIAEGMPVKRKDGSVFYADISSSPITLDRKRCLVGIFRDITKRMQVQRELESSLSQLKSTLDATADGILVVGRNGKIVAFSKRFVKMWRMPAHILDKKDDQLALDYILDQLADPDGFLKKVNALYADLEAKSFDTIDFKDGRTFERYSRPHLLNDDIIGRVWSFRDVTERQRTEDALQEREAFLSTLLNAIAAPVFFKDVDGRYLGFNEAFETFFGKTKEHLIGKTVFDINPPELAEVYHTKDLELLQNRGIQKYEGQVKNNRGELRDVIFHKSVFTDAKGTVKGLIGTILDITERKRIEVEKENLIRELQEALKEIKALRKILPICSFCKKVRGDKGYWQQVDVYIHQHSLAEISHSICPDCAQEHYPDLEIYD